MSRSRAGWIVASLLFGGVHSSLANPTAIVQDFESGSLDGWTFTDAKAFRIGEGDRGKCLELFQKAKYNPKVRSPLGLAILEAPVVSDFVLDVRLRSTVKDYGHRDLCIVFGYQDPEHFYYVHLGKKADPHSNSIFLVDGAPRVSIAKTTSKGTDWTDGWHNVRVRRDSSTGEIEVYFDNMEKPVMTAVDRKLTQGKIGLGSFDDLGMFDDLTLEGKVVDEGK
jgi:hypothetical protein